MPFFDIQSKPADYKEFVGVNGDSKPTEGVGVNSLFHELDTNDVYYFTGEAWAKVGGDSTPAAEG